MAPDDRTMTRRGLFHRVGSGVYGAALAYLLGRDVYGTADAKHPHDLKPRRPHHVAKAKAVIHLFMNGGPSQMDLFDPKPTLDKRHGQRYFDRIAGEVENPQSAGALMRSPFRFAQHGKSGMWVSDSMPHLARQ